MMKSIFTRLAFSTILLLLGGANRASATVVYVRSSVGASGAGTDWTTAYKTLQEALVAANGNGAITEVWVGAGTYYPTGYPAGSTGGTTIRDYAFGLKSGVAIYGGFAGTETATNQRVAGNTTILSGDIGVAGANSDNCYHVVIGDGVNNTAVLDGVTVTLGNANVAGIGITGFERSVGGGIYNLSASPTITNCIVSYNSSGVSGGGMYNTASSPIISGCTFLADSATSATVGVSGGAMNNQNVSNPVVSNCLFSGNVATSSTSAFGGSIENSNNSTLTLSNCRLLGNTVSVYGGGGCIDNSGILIATNCVFSENLAGLTSSSTIGTGGAIQSADGTSTLTNCIFSKNSAFGKEDDGGGAISVYGGSVVLKNCTFWDNTTTSPYNSSGNAVSVISSGAALTATNTIMWGAGPQVFNAGTASIEFSNIKCSYAGTGNINSDPGFSNVAFPAGADGIWQTSDDGLSLQACSPSINTGTTTSPVIPNDYLGNPRVGIYDMGAYEYQGVAVQSTLATANATFTTDECTTTTFGDCSNIVATIAPGGASQVSGSITAKVFVQANAPSYNAQPYVRRYYDIRPVTDPDAATATITLYFLQSDFDNYNASRGTFPSLPIDIADAAGYKANLRITQQHGISTTGAPGTYTGWAGVGPDRVLITPSISYNSTAARWEVTFPVTGFSGFFAHTGAVTPLPIKLLSFTANQAAANRNRINWTTATEQGIYSFEVARSGNGSDFKTIGTVRGNNKRYEYTYYDEQPLPGNNYYRLNSIDASGSSTYSNIAIVRSTANSGSVTVAPVPADRTIRITNTDASMLGQEMVIYNMQGMVVYQAILKGDQSIDISSWALGVYALHLVDSQVVRIVKQ